MAGCTRVVGLEHTVLGSVTYSVKNIALRGFHIKCMATSLCITYYVEPCLDSAS